VNTQSGFPTTNGAATLGEIHLNQKNFTNPGLRHRYIRLMNHNQSQRPIQ